MIDWKDAYRGRRVLLTGHTGFKGGWLAAWLRRLGAEVTGYALPPATDPSLFEDAAIGAGLTHVIGDVRNLDRLRETWSVARPEVVFHLAAQPIVRESYRDPLETLTTNAIGTANVLECARLAGQPVALVMITSDKCYENLEVEHGYAETDQLGGHDIYSSSKACAEVIVSSYRRSFFKPGAPIAVASARAGNVIGGGDWAKDRIVPDAIRSLIAGETIAVRNPRAVRPWQHVLEPLSGYLKLGAALLDGDPRARSAWNFGPAIANTRTVGELVTRVIDRWGAGDWRDASDPNAPHEATLLRLNIDKAAAELQWTPRLSFEEAVDFTVEWYRARHEGQSAAECCQDQIARYEAHGR